MAKNARYRLPYRRRRERKTDYQARRILATSKHPRFVVRTNNKGVIVQIVKSEIIGDEILIQATSKELSSKYGWQASGKNIPAGYLLGYVSGKKAVNAGIKIAYLDLGLKRPTKGSKVFAVVKGAIDAGLEIPCNTDVVPPPDRMNGGDIAKYAKEMENPTNYEKQFSSYLRKGIQPETLPEHFEKTKKKIEENWAK